MTLEELEQTNHKLILQVYSTLKQLESEYPDFAQWYFQKVIPGIGNGTRRIFVVLDNEKIAAVLILKDSEEKKICTLRVSEDYRGKGIGTQLLQLACRELCTFFPLITVSGTHKDEYTGLFKNNFFHLTEIHPGYYIHNSAEYCFNGSLKNNYTYFGKSAVFDDEKHKYLC